jgi:hypothetical protein
MGVQQAGVVAGGEGGFGATLGEDADASPDHSFEE